MSIATTASLKAQLATHNRQQILDKHYKAVIIVTN